MEYWPDTTTYVGWMHFVDGILVFFYKVVCCIVPGVDQMPFSSISYPLSFRESPSTYLWTWSHGVETVDLQVGRLGGVAHVDPNSLKYDLR
jgi:hypothetical protein